MPQRKLIKVSTKTGDKGESGLANGQRVAKSSLVFSALGDLDELNSWIGVIIANMDDRFTTHKETLLDIQEQLFYVGAEVAASPKTKFSKKALTRIEKESDELQLKMADDWHAKFLLPGGSQLGAWCDVARAVCRRAERSVAKYADEGTVSSLVRQYINRLSDYLYVLRCFINQEQAVTEKEFISK